jgi:phenylalanine ammonia-lyase
MHQQGAALTEPDNHSTLVISDTDLTIDDLIDVSYYDRPVALSNETKFEHTLLESVCVVQRALERDAPVYGVNTNFGGMADSRVSAEKLSDLQFNLIWGLKCGAGRDLPVPCVRAAMLLRSHSLSRGASGIRRDLIARLLSFLNHGITPVLKDLGSLGASGDLIPLSYIAGALAGLDRSFCVSYRGRAMDCVAALKQLQLEPVQLGPKEGLALVNGTSVSTGMAAIAVHETMRLLDLSLWINALMCSAMCASRQPFDPFVHRMKPHPGQQEVAATMRSLLVDEDGEPIRWRTKPGLVQDQYSIRCIPQYFGPLVDGLRTIMTNVETEMNSADDNPLIDVQGDRVVQAGNFYSQYIGIGMDQLRQYVALIAKQLDAQISLLVTPEFNRGLPACLAESGDDIDFGLKGLQIYLNSVLPRLLHLGNPLVPFFPTHAEQFNQNINSQSFNSAVLALEAVTLLKYYLSAALIFAVQGIEVRASQFFGPYTGSNMLNAKAAKLLHAVYEVIECTPAPDRPLVARKWDVPIDQLLGRLFCDLNANESRIFQVLFRCESEETGRTMTCRRAGNG